MFRKFLRIDPTRAFIFCPSYGEFWAHAVATMLLGDAFMHIQNVLHAVATKEHESLVIFLSCFLIWEGNHVFALARVWVIVSSDSSVEVWYTTYAMLSEDGKDKLCSLARPFSQPWSGA